MNFLHTKSLYTYEFPKVYIHMNFLHTKSLYTYEFPTGTGNAKVIQTLK